MGPHSQLTIHTGLAIEIPTGVYLRIASRSSMSKQGINVGTGVVDNDYRGEVKVILQNTTSQPFTVQKHSRIAQFIFEKKFYTLYRYEQQTLQNNQRNRRFWKHE